VAEERTPTKLEGGTPNFALMRVPGEKEKWGGREEEQRTEMLIWCQARLERNVAQGGPLEKRQLSRIWKFS